jgi:hypothetical protein
MLVGCMPDSEYWIVLALVEERCDPKTVHSVARPCLIYGVDLCCSRLCHLYLHKDVKLHHRLGYSSIGCLEADAAVHMGAAHNFANKT